MPPKREIIRLGRYLEAAQPNVWEEGRGLGEQGHCKEGRSRAEGWGRGNVFNITRQKCASVASNLSSGFSVPIR